MIPLKVSPGIFQNVPLGIAEVYFENSSRTSTGNYSRIFFVWELVYMLLLEFF